MTRRAVAVVLIVVLLGGCATTGQTGSEPSPGKSAGVGAGVGAVLGAIIGAVVGGHRGALIGAMAGAAIGGITGYAWGEYNRRTVMSRDEAVKAAAYTPEQGFKLVIHQTYAAPDPVRPGASVRLGGNYAVLAPDASADVLVKEIREILYDGQVVATASERDERVAQGGAESDQEFKIPANAREGQYTYRLTVLNPLDNTREVRESTFTVIRG